MTDSSSAEPWRGDYRPGLHYFLALIACCTALLLFAGAEVTSRGAGLAVPDWPLSFGEWWPDMVGGVYYEHGHRAIAAAIGFLTLVATVWSLAVEKRRWARGLVLVCLGAVVLQGILGGMTVLHLLPTWLSTSHATLGQTFFCLITAAAIVTSKSFLAAAHGGGAEEARTFAGLRRWVVVAVVCLYGQLILGGVMRHSEAGLAIPTVPLAYGQVVPSLSEESMKGYRGEMLRILSATVMEIDERVEEMALNLSPYKVAIHFAHRVGAVVVSLVLLGLVAYIFARHAQHLMLVGLACTIAGLLTLQICLGFFVILTLKTPNVASLHVLGGALLLNTTVSLGIWAWRLPAVRGQVARSASHQEAAAFVAAPSP